MDRDTNAPETPVELGTVSGDTQGNMGAYWEAAGLQRALGLTDD